MSSLINRVSFTQLVDAALSADDSTRVLADVLSKIHSKRQHTIKELREKDVHKSTRMHFMNLVTLFKEQIDVLTDLMAAGEAAAALWEDEARFYESPGGAVFCKCAGHEIMCENNFPAHTQLVCTPLTRQCRKQQIQAYCAGKVYAAAGPAGTGKTETIKDTYRMLGREPVVINTNEEMTDADFERISKEHKANAGMVPIVFDEFNRLDSAKQVSCLEILQQAEHCVCITFNPGYKGFEPLDARVLAQIQQPPQPMTRPDLKCILQVMLGSQGFVECDTLGASLLTAVLELQQRMTKQPHYDFGLRFVKSLVTAAGALLRASSPGSIDESQLLADACFSMLYPRTSVLDRPLVSAEAVGQRFGVAAANIPDGWTTTTSSASSVDGTSTSTSKWAAAAAMVASQAKRRHGVAVVGPSMANDSEARACLAEVEKTMGAESVLVGDGKQRGGLTCDCIGKPWHTLTPEEKEQQEKIVAAEVELIAAALQQATARVAQPNSKPQLLVLTGPHNALSLEPMNSVLDDNKVLLVPAVAAATAATRIPLPGRVTVLLMSADCADWSPASVSRVGVVYVAPEEEESRQKSEWECVPSPSEPNRSRGDGSSVKTTIKISRGDDTRRVAISSGSYANLCDLVRHIFGQSGSGPRAHPLGSFTLHYTDDEGDRICIGSDMEVAEALRVAAEQGKALRLLVAEQ